jgi:galactokinase/mevalonate kinase-like predicted kinase
MINNWDMKDDNNEILASKDQPTGGQLATSSAILVALLARPGDSSLAPEMIRMITPSPFSLRR